jgi:hypothetical protein
LPNTTISQIFYLLQRYSIVAQLFNLLLANDIISDILSEVDGNPSVRVPLSTSINIKPPSITGDFDSEDQNGEPHVDYFSANLWLRSCLNHILGHAFTTEQAYCQPREISPFITEISLDIKQWYHSLPLHLHIVCDLRSWRLLNPLPNLRVVSWNPTM